MELFDTLFGNEKLKATAATDIYCGRASHAYVLEGPEGSGRHTAAKLMASALLCTEKNGARFPCGKCLSCRKVAEGICTDVITVNRGSKATIGVDVIRELKASLSFAPVEMERKIYVVEEADRMTVQAQNSFLLSLEEPPEFVTFILLCADSSLLLETVRSRAPVIRMQLFSAKVISEYLQNSVKTKKAASNAEKLAAAVASSGGAIGKAERLLTDRNAPELRTASLCRAILPDLLSNSPSKRLEILKKFPTGRDELSSFLSTLDVALRDLVCMKKNRESELLFFYDAEEAAELCSSCTLKRLMSLADGITEAKTKLASNVSAQPVLMLLVTKN